MITGWRVGILRPEIILSRSRRDTYGSPLMWSECLFADHDAPDPDCTCGMYLVPDLAVLLDAIHERPGSCELHPWRALLRGRGLLDALRTGHLPDYVARATSHGTVYDASTPTDPAGSVRCEAVTLTEVYLLHHAAGYLDDLTSEVGLTPTVTTLAGLSALRQGAQGPAGGQIGHSDVDALRTSYEQEARS